MLNPARTRSCVFLTLALEATSCSANAHADPHPAENLPCVAPLLYGHRGTPNHRPENTLHAFEWAASYEIDGIELDVRMSADGHMVAIHDSGVARTTNGGNQSVGSLDLAELQALDAGSWFDAAYSDAFIPTIDEVLDAVERPGFRYIWDIKDPQVLPDLVELIEAWDLSERSIIAGTSFDVLDDACALAPTIPTLIFISSLSAIPEDGGPCLRYIRIPGSVQYDRSAQDTALEAGYEVAVGGAAVDWDIEIMISDNPHWSIDLRESRRPEHCFEETPSN